MEPPGYVTYTKIISVNTVNYNNILIYFTSCFRAGSPC